MRLQQHNRACFLDHKSNWSQCYVYLYRSVQPFKNSANQFMYVNLVSIAIVDQLGQSHSGNSDGVNNSVFLDNSKVIPYSGDCNPLLKTHNHVDRNLKEYVQNHNILIIYHTYFYTFSYSLSNKQVTKHPLYLRNLPPKLRTKLSPVKTT